MFWFKHRDALAHRRADWLRLERIHELERPLMELVTEVLPLLAAAEMRGERPTFLQLPAARVAAIETAAAEVDKLRGVSPRGGAIMLLGLRIVAGERMEVS